MTNFAYWPGREPENAPKTLLVKAGMPPADMSYPHAHQLEAWTAANGWTSETTNTVIVGNSDWRSYSSYHLLREPDDDTGKVTPEITAEFLVNGMQGIRRLDEWWKAYLVELNRLDLPVHIVALDWECGFSRGWKYDLDGNGVDAFSMHEVVDVAMPWPGLMRKFPRVDWASFRELNLYGNRKNEQSAIIWNHWVAHSQSARLNETFADQTREFYPEAHISNYNYVNTTGAPLLSFLVDVPQYNPAVGNSGFLAYLSNDTGYKTNAEVVAAFQTVADPAECTVWVGHWDRNTNGWLCSKEQFDELVDYFNSQGVAAIVVF